MRFLDGGTKKASPSLLDVGVEAAIDTSKFDEVAFFKRGGKYVWSKVEMKLDWWLARGHYVLCLKQGPQELD